MARSVLIVDDSVSMRALVRTTLKSLGYVVEEASNGRDALEKAQAKQTFDLIITDLNMPVMDGIMLIQGLRKLANFKHTPVLLLTTESRPEHKAKAKAAGATGWLTKPFDADALTAVVRRVLP